MTLAMIVGEVLFSILLLFLTTTASYIGDPDVALPTDALPRSPRRRALCRRPPRRRALCRRPPRRRSPYRRA